MRHGVLTAALLTVMLLGPVETLAATATNLQTNLAGLDRILDLLEEIGFVRYISSEVPLRSV